MGRFLLSLPLVLLASILSSPSSVQASTVLDKSTSTYSDLDARSFFDPRATLVCQLLQRKLGKDKVVDPFTDLFAYNKSQANYYNFENVVMNFPSCVVLPQSSRDVSKTLKTIKAHHVKFAVKSGGGHNTNLGWSSVNKGILLDLRKMREISLSKDGETATYQPGLKWNDIYSYLEKYNKTVVGGRSGDVGVGLSLGGGLSHLSAQHGLSCDNFVSLEVVLPSGKIVTATKDNHYSDLFFGMKGGLGTLGVVTSFEVSAYDVGEWYNGYITILPEHSDEVLKATVKFTENTSNSKAAVIVTRNVNNIPGIPDAWLIILAHQGADPGDSYKMFSDIPHVSYTNQTTTIAAIAATDVEPVGPRRIYRAAAYENHLDQLRELNKAFEEWTSKHNTSIISGSLDIQPIQQSLIDAGRKRGGNAIQSPDGPYIWVNTLFASSSDLNPFIFHYAYQDFEKFYPKSSNRLPLYVNDGEANQQFLRKYGAFERLKHIKNKYDPQGFFTRFSDGPSYD